LEDLYVGACWYVACISVCVRAFATVSVAGCDKLC
jgi:hypothetical protein